MKADACFFTKVDSIAMLLKQLISAALKSFSHNDIYGAESDKALEIEDEGDSNKISSNNQDDLVAQKIKRFAQDMKNEEQRRRRNRK